MAKPEKPAVPPSVVENLVAAAESVQDKFDADPELKDLYYDGFSSLLDEIGKNVKTPVSDEKKSEIVVDNHFRTW
jgi:uncharacterized protein with ParB-like and HNH nuclease domain